MAAAMSAPRGPHATNSHADAEVLVHRRTFLRGLGAALAATAAACRTPGGAPAARPTRRLRRVGIQLYTLRDAARQDLERALAEDAVRA
jgi:hypothetical protein